MKVLFWTIFIDKLYRNEGNPGGLAIQMSYWAQVFAQNGWKVYSLSDKKKQEYNNISFLRYYNIHFIGIFVEWILALYYILKESPDLIIMRGASRSTLPLFIFAKFVKAKLVFLGASDSDFIPGEELINANHDKKIYRNGVKNIRYFVVQNEQQKELLQTNYGEKCVITIPNIWPSAIVAEQEKDIDFLWVSNFRSLKRPEWFIKLAKEHPMYRFTMIGGLYEREVYEKCEKAAADIPNLSFLGKKSFDETNGYFSRARCFICTSTMEGFPNTFLQAWSNNIPVLTTFSPSKLVETHNLGTYVTEYSDIRQELRRILEEPAYKEKQEAIKAYFEDSHSPQRMYNKLIKMLDK